MDKTTTNPPSGKRPSSRQDPIGKFVRDQFSVWPEAAANYRGLKRSDYRDFALDGLRVRVQHNPARVRSSEADLSAETLSSRPCFLCRGNRPSQQHALLFEGRKGRRYDILVNPYPIFRDHLVIALQEHRPQSIWQHYVDMADLAHHFPGFTFFYNGPCCGASAPDHLHFQACRRGSLPLERDVDRILDRIVVPSHGVPYGEEVTSIPPEVAEDVDFVTTVQEAQLFHYKHFTRGVFVLRARTSKSLAKLFYRLLDCADIPEGEQEPRINMLTWYRPVPSGRGPSSRPPGFAHGMAGFEYRAVVVFRSRHRSHHYDSPGADHLAMSPGCADMAGLFIAPRREDFLKLDAPLLRQMLDEVSLDAPSEQKILWRLTRRQPQLQVGIMAGEEITFEIISDGAGPQKVSYQEGKICYNGALYDELLFDAQTMSTLFAQPSFILYGVTIGVDFHWQQQMTQRFAGSLKFIVEKGKVAAVNVIGVEDYLVSVISSEMSPTASLEYLKAHAVISRSWVMAQIRHRAARAEQAQRRSGAGAEGGVPGLVTRLMGVDGSPYAAENKEDVQPGCLEIRSWSDHEDHVRFDVCADDHCQRYQGFTDLPMDKARAAVDATWGQVLAYDGEICDTRFSKCCGGVMERFSSCWEDVDPPYLQVLPDTPDHRKDGRVYCDTQDPAILSQVMKDYDLETRDFYRWTVRYDIRTLSALIARRSGHDIGLLEDLVPLERGGSGRITRLEIKGSKQTLIVGKELVIRKFLSDSHLKSSNFTVQRPDSDTLVLEGKGWGHGVGLCQIGAAVMASEGHPFDEILSHYYPGAVLADAASLNQ